MKKLALLLITCSVIISCSNSQKSETKEQQTAPEQKIEKTTPPATSQKELFAVESAYVKYKTNAAGQEMIREWWFDQHGNRQYEENYMTIFGEKSGSNSLVVDGVKYMWDLNSETGTKSKFYQAATDYDNLSESDIERYGIEKHGYEEILGKKCLKVTTEKPAKSTTWIWNGVPMKTKAAFGSTEVVMEAIEISTESIDNKLFELPATVTFSALN